MSSPAPTGTALAHKILAIMNDLGPIEKGGFNSYFQYRFYREEDFIEAVKPLLIKHRVTLSPNVLRDTVTPVTTAKGGTEILVSVAIEYTLIDVDTGDSMQMVSIGHGQDAGDKGLPKAMTGAMKAFLRQLFMITAGSVDAEDTNDAPPARQQNYQSAPLPQNYPQGQQYQAPPPQQAPQQAPPVQQQQAPPPQNTLPPRGDGGSDNATGFCPAHRKAFRIGNKGNRYCPTKVDEQNGQPVWCNEGYAYDQQYGYVNSGGPQQQAPQSQPVPQSQPQYSGQPMDVDDIPF